MTIENHWLCEATKIPSPNFDERPVEEDISLIVVHCISLPPGEFGNHYINDLFCNQLDADAHPYFEGIYKLKVSAHLLIKRTGEIIQYVPFNQRAWHAGQSIYRGRERCNDFSIGIELEGTELVPYADEQYQVLSAVVAELLSSYPKLSVQHITGHSDIAPGRKTDPGQSFDWTKLLGFLNK
ncbi:1,6-anhydro-N-acetylmuramyl-L-alanine amidase AmpD [Methylosoma difficile]